MKVQEVNFLRHLASKFIIAIWPLVLSLFLHGNYVAYLCFEACYESPCIGTNNKNYYWRIFKLYRSRW